jgi:purine-binding chemotaxis protein CheW
MSENQLVVNRLSVEEQMRRDFGEESGFVTFRINDQFFGIPVGQVQDVLHRQRLTPIPLAAPEITGAVNLRGRIVTAINMRERLRIPMSTEMKPPMNIVVEHQGELFSLWVDSVGDVLSLGSKQIEKSPPNLAVHWQQFVKGVCQLRDELLLILDVGALLKIGANA